MAVKLNEIDMLIKLVMRRFIRYELTARRSGYGSTEKMVTGPVTSSACMLPRQCSAWKCCVRCECSSS